MSSSRLFVLAGPLALLVVAACGVGGTASTVRPEAPKYEPGASKCGTALANWRPLIVEWSAPDRAGLEARIRNGLVAARVTGCEIQILPDCSGKTKYVYSATTPKQDMVRIRNKDELQATLPFGAARLGASLERSGALSVKMSVAGIYAAEQAIAKPEDLKGACDTATHVVTGFATGAFEFFSGADATVGANASAAGVGVDGKSSSLHEILNRDGDEAACRTGKTSDTAPPEGCAAILRLSLARIDCFEGMIYVEGKGCRPLPPVETNEQSPLLEGIEPPKPLRGLQSSKAEADVMRFESLGAQLKELPPGSPLWAKRVGELKRQWERFGASLNFDRVALERDMLGTRGGGTPEQKAELERLQKLVARSKAAVAEYDRLLTQ